MSNRNLFAELNSALREAKDHSDVSLTMPLQAQQLNNASELHYLRMIEPLRAIHKKYRLQEGDVSSHTKSALRITLEWQQAVCKGLVKSEVKVSPENNERIDVVDSETNTAYELKVSGKNTHHEFYKDLVKVLTYNEYQEAQNKIKKLIFISELSGISLLKARLDSKFIQMLLGNHRLSIELISLE